VIPETCHFPYIFLYLQIEIQKIHFYSLCSWRDFASECFCFGGGAVNASSEAARRVASSLANFLGARGKKMAASAQNIALTVPL